MTFLIAGKHGALTDTMIFAHVDHKKREVYLVSIPRDLYVDGRKINHIYHDFGIDELARQISKLTGFKIDKYILIDMYAFIDVVDLIGGVDVHLKNAVIDPTYKTFDNGEWGTLAYAPGNHHLNGKEALRIARSRHFSSDFNRAARQQVILSALRDKAVNLGFGDAGTLAGIIETILAKTESNIEFQEAISFYFRYQNFKIKDGHVLSGLNVLKNSAFQVPSEASEDEKAKCLTVTVAEDDKELCAKFPHAYILLPKNGDWDLIKWYIKEVIEGKI